jgi:hypothetical protein
MPDDPRLDVIDYRMATDTWMRWTNGLWLAALLTLVVVCLPTLRRIEALCRAGSEGGSSAGYPAVLGRWRAGNTLLSVLYLALLVLMVFRWRG